MSEKIHFSKYAKADIQKVLDFVALSQPYLPGFGAVLHHTVNYAQGFEEHFLCLLKAANFEDAPHKIKVIVTNLQNFILNPENGYARDNQVAAVAGAMRKEGRVHTRLSISLPDYLLQWWENMSSTERGDWVAAQIEGDF